MEDEDDEEVDSEGSGSEDENMSCKYIIIYFPLFFR